MGHDNGILSQTARHADGVVKAHDLRRPASEGPSSDARRAAGSTVGIAACSWGVFKPAVGKSVASVGHSRPRERRRHGHVGRRAGGREGRTQAARMFSR